MIERYLKFRCQGQHCRHCLGEVDTLTGRLIQKSKRWHVSNEIVTGLIQCQCGWQFYYKAEKFIDINNSKLKELTKEV
jgi:hypothetical protein